MSSSTIDLNSLQKLLQKLAEEKKLLIRNEKDYHALLNLVTKKRIIEVNDWGFRFSWNFCTQLSMWYENTKKFLTEVIPVSEKIVREAIGILLGEYGDTSEELEILTTLAERYVSMIMQRFLGDYLKRRSENFRIWRGF